MPGFDTKIFKQTGALKEGHFLLASGLHSGYYFQAQTLLKYPKKASRVAKKLAKKWKGNSIDAAVSLAVGGIVLGQEISRQLGCRHIFLERKDENFSLRRGFHIKPGEKVLIIEDVVTTGGSIKEAIDVIKGYDADIIGITSLLQRGETDFDYPFQPLLKVNWPAYSPQDCPLCRDGIPIHISGTKQSKIKSSEKLQ